MLESLKDGSLYKGYTDNLKRRFLEHNQKRGGSCTSKHAPFKINYYESFLEKADAAKSERFFKIGYGREVLRDRLGN